MSLRSLLERLIGLSKSEKFDEIYDDFNEQSKTILEEVKNAKPNASDDFLEKVRRSIVKDGTSKFMEEHGDSYD